MTTTIRLTLKKGPRVIETFEFVDPSKVLVGRNEECDVQIESTSVSRHHCELIPDDGFFRLADLTSKHGTFVNGRRSMTSGLDEGDVLTVGEFQLVYSAEFPERATGPKKPVRRGMGATIQIDGEAAGKGQARAQARGHLTYVDAAGNTRNLILEKATTIAGKVRHADVDLTGWRVPRVAALILRERLGFKIIDTSPRGNAVGVNGKYVREATLKTGDQLVIWNRVLRFFSGLPKLEAEETKERKDWGPLGR